MQRRLYIAPAIQPLARAAIMGFKLRKLTLPEAENIARHIAQPRNLADAKVKLIRDLRSV
jgi:hypothetical protein